MEYVQSTVAESSKYESTVTVQGMKVPIQVRYGNGTFVEFFLDKYCACTNV